MKDVLDLLGRAFIAFIFLFEAYDSLIYFQDTKATMTEYGITWNQEFLLTFSIGLLILGGLLILTGYKTKFGAALLLCYWIPLTFILYSFWNDPVETKRLNSILFMKNIAIAGGLILLFVNGSGKYSVRRLLSATKPVFRN